MDIETLRFPIGRFSWSEDPSNEQKRSQQIGVIATFPNELNAAVRGLTEMQLDTAYRPEGWTIRQVVHHCADSHLNSFIRFKLALTEDRPNIKPYDEAAWAELPDSLGMPLHSSLKIIEGVHHRWSVLLGGLDNSGWNRNFIHPEQGREIGLEEYLAFYAWHGIHHLAHINGCKERNGW
jgi:hypothetical protein